MRKTVLFCFLALLTLYQGVRYSQHHTRTRIHKNRILAPLQAIPGTTIFAFDLHHVLFIPHYTKAAQIVINAPHKIKLLTTLLNPFSLYDFLTIDVQVFEQAIFNLCKKYPQLTAWEKTALTIGNAQQPIAHTFSLINQLKKRGFKIYLMSNIGSIMFNDLHDTYKHLFAAFDDLFITWPELSYLQKPHTGYFRLFLDTYHLHPEQVIFIDDNPSNLSAAAHVGIAGIHFTTPTELEKTLIHIGAL